MSPRLRRPLSWLLAGVVLAVVLAALAIGLVTQTDRGRARVLTYTVEALGGGLNGTLVIDRLEGNVLTGARLHGFALYQLDGRPFLVADSAHVEYDLPTFLGGDLVIDRLTIFRGTLWLKRFPADTMWNYQEVLLDTTESVGPGRATLIDRMELVDARIEVRMPWEPEVELGSTGYTRAEIEAFADTSRVVLEPAPGGYARRMSFSLRNAVLRKLTVAPDERGGSYLELEDAAGRLWLHRHTPLVVEGASGQLALREGVVYYRAPRILLPSAPVESAGVIDLSGGDPRYDLFLEGRRVRTGDLRWLHTGLPDEGSVSARFWFETRPGGLRFLVRDGRLVLPDTRIQGSFGLQLGDTLRILEADLEAEPLDMRTVQRLLPGDLPIEGLRIRSAVVESPAS